MDKLESIKVIPTVQYPKAHNEPSISWTLPAASLGHYSVGRFRVACHIVRIAKNSTKCKPG